MEPTDLEQPDAAPLIPAEPAPPIHSRFLFVDVAAMRAKQLRRGATPRLDDNDDHVARSHWAQPHKSERVAMEEVRRGLVLYEVPASTRPVDLR